jgi:hemoglobin
LPSSNTGKLRIAMDHPPSIRPEAPGAACGVDEALVREIVVAFYAKVRADEALGPIFHAAVDDWPAHLDKLCAFWSSVTLMSGSYKGNPFKVHVDLPDIRDEHFRRWLGLFRETLNSIATPEQRDVFTVRAERIADSFRFGIARARGEVAEPLKR